VTPPPLLECPRCHQQVTQVELLQCRSCHGYTHQLQPDGRCLDCHLGWTHCPTHARLEHAGSDHKRVTAAEVLTTFRARHDNVTHPPTPTSGPRGVSAPR